MCLLGGRQCKTIPILGFHILVHLQLNRPLTGSETSETKTWTFPLKKIAVKITQCTNIWDKDVQFLHISCLFHTF